MSPLAPYANQMTVSVLTTEDLPGVPEEWEPNRVAGVKASVAAPPGVSRAFIQRRIACYRATTASSDNDILLVDGGHIAVRETMGRFEVSVTSDDAAVAQRIVAALGTSQASGAVAPQAVASAQ